MDVPVSKHPRRRMRFIAGLRSVRIPVFVASTIGAFAGARRRVVAGSLGGKCGRGMSRTTRATQGETAVHAEQIGGFDGELDTGSNITESESTITATPGASGNTDYPSPLQFEQIRHKPPTKLKSPRELIIACSPLKSHVNLSAIIRTAGCSGVTKVIATGPAKVLKRIARDGADQVEVEAKNTLKYTLKAFREQGYTLVGLEQTTNSQSLHDFQFPRKSVLVVGAERAGLSQECLDQVHHCVEIPVWGVPFSYNVATATALATYEYCRQYPDG